MNRDEALVHLKSVMDAVMESVGRTTGDSANGYKPALDSAFRQYISKNSLSTGLEDTDTDPVEDTCFLALLEAVTYDMLLPTIAATQVDFSVDAPLTSVKFSQSYRAIREARAAAWERASSCGYGVSSNVSAFRIGLGYNEPTWGTRREYS